MSSSSMDVDTPLLHTLKRPHQRKRQSWAAAPETIKTNAVPDFNLTKATQASLLKKTRDVLEKYCEERGLLVIHETGLTKKEMTALLLNWREQQQQPDTVKGQPVTQANAHHPPAIPLLSRLDPSSLISALKITPENDLGGLPTPEPSPSPPHADSLEDSIDASAALDSLELTDKLIEPSKIQRGDKIGSGGFKDVYKGRFGRFRVAVSDLRGTLTKDDVKELGLLKDFRHPNVVRFIGVSISLDKTVSIITELALNGDLFHYIRSVPCPDLNAQLEMFLGAARGLQYLHGRTPPVIHRDIKSLNVLISSKGVAKLNDFGLARVKNTIQSMIHSQVGTVNWQAPELWVPSPSYSFEIDTYALGLVFWEILTWHLPEKLYPFQGMSDFAIYAEVGEKKLRPSTSHLRKRYGNIVVNLAHALWNPNPKERPTMKDVCEALEWMLEEHKAGRLVNA